jgi:hypothetical protein
MALFFSLKKLEEASCNDSNTFMLMLWYHYTKALPKTEKHRKYTGIDLKGQSFLLNPLPLFTDKSTDTLFKLQYIKLAGRRDYHLYKQYKYKRLDISFFPDLIYDSIKYNPLLEITPKEIIFKLEEF